MNSNPSPIRVKQGARVQLKITATDHAHGIKPSPEGGKRTDNPGLMFSSPQSCQRIEKHQTATVEFIAKTAGTYRFKCCTFCGWHHRE
jgi:heme/copper-type cytochrome/quinol oxidase subunit 2